MRRTASSGDVSRPLILDMFSLRLLLSTMSVMVPIFSSDPGFERREAELSLSQHSTVQARNARVIDLGGETFADGSVAGEGVLVHISLSSS